MFLDRCDELDACIVDDDIEAPMILTGTLHHDLDGVGLGHVSLGEHDLHAEFVCNLPLNHGNLIRLAKAVQRDVGPATASARDAKTDAAVWRPCPDRPREGNAA
jgi:hypothetical protein